jgi:hypothetical protein
MEMKKRVVKIVIGVFVANVLLGSAALGVIAWRTHQSVQEYCNVAQQAHPHPSDDVASLTDFMNSNSHSFRDRNFAVWTLGHLRDAKALPALKSAYNGTPCDHENRLCQYELEKAIKRCGGVPTPPRTTKH